MARIAERLGRLMGGEEPMGIRPVAAERRALGTLDFSVLWFDLSVGLLVLVTGALLVPALGLGAALAAIAVGTLIGCVPLALVALAGQREGVPTMVLFRPVLGARGSLAPSALNVVQLVGWTAVEFWAMGEVASVASRRLFGFGGRTFWIAAVAVVCTALAAGGPVIVVRRWLERFGIWVLLGSAAWITVVTLRAGELGSLGNAPATGGMPFWLAVDLVIVMPVSWLPLAADYSRFARTDARAALGTYVGYAAGNAWFYALGAMLVLATGVVATPVGIGAAVVALAGGGVVLLALLVGESDNAFADIYSAAVSTQNIAPRARQRAVVVAVGAIAFALALGFSAERFELFLFLIGSVFVPLAAVFLADYLVRRRGRLGEDALFEPSGVRWLAFVPWVVGFIVYHWCVPTGPSGWVEAVTRAFDALGLPFPLLGSRLGATVPSFAVAFLLTLVMPMDRSNRSARSRVDPARPATAAEPRRAARPPDRRSRS
ncbi:MAG TPA: cytosine permease [Actinomycetota bacterium]|jgi:putative hydroxymethylpyrimidine transporter CytX